jgi:hypothetical protein
LEWSLGYKSDFLAALEESAGHIFVHTEVNLCEVLHLA